MLSTIIVITVTTVLSGMLIYGKSDELKQFFNLK